MGKGKRRVDQETSIRKLEHQNLEGELSKQKETLELERLVVDREGLKVFTGREMRKRLQYGDWKCS